MRNRRPRAVGTSLAAAAGALLLIFAAPLAASAAEVNYHSSTSTPMNVWQYSGHHTMNGSKAYGYGFTQVLHLKQDNTSQVNGYEEISVSTASPAFTLSMCAWSGAAPGTTFALTCNYLN